MLLHNTYAIFVEHSENEGGEFRWIAVGKELLVDLYETLKITQQATFILKLSPYLVAYRFSFN